MQKKEQEPQYIMSALNTPMLNYRVYYMTVKEKIINFLMAFIIGGAVGLVFYGGQFRDSDGAATKATLLCNIILFLMIGVVTVIIYFPIRKKQLKNKRRLQLTKQFRGLLEALAVSLSSGMNMSDALNSSYHDLKLEYTEDAYIVLEIKEMLSGLENNIPIEDMMMALGERSEIDDIRNFGVVFSLCYRAGGNLKDIVRRTNSIMSEKMEIAEEIETSLASNKTQFTAMMCIPVVMVLLLRMMSSSFAASFSTAAGVMAITVAIGIFIIAFRIGQKITDIKG